MFLIKIYSFENERRKLWRKILLFYAKLDKSDSKTGKV